ncbi:MAG: hypothetical protein K2X57_03595 [Xanthobacteraceae bacterium]|nr:hypothetical protein [Xanthobacteraceae bacterium]
MPNDDTVKPPASEPDSLRTGPGRYFNLMNTIIGLPIVTILGGLVASYIQYSIAYQEKIASRGAEELKAASETFNDISKKFAEAQTLQQMLLSDFSTAIDSNADSSEHTLAAKHARSIFPTYEKVSNALLGAADVMAYDAERYIDWASDLASGSENKRPYSDPITHGNLRFSDFDCEYHVPYFSGPSASGTNTCLSGNTDQARDPPSPVARICPRKKSNDASPILIDWYSEKHEVITMHYCFQALHDRLMKVRFWASQEETSSEAKAAFQAEREQMQSAIDHQSLRLTAFMSLGLFRIDSIQLRYRPISFECQIPFFKPSHGCRPVTLAP